MTKNRLFGSAIIAGVLTTMIDLAVEKMLNGDLISSDFGTAFIAGLLTGLVIVLLFRNREHIKRE